MLTTATWLASTLGPAAWLSMAFLMAPASGPTTGDSVPGLMFADSKGKLLKLDEPGMLYLVDFWLVTCRPCIEEMPELDRLANEYEPSGRVRFVRVLPVTGTDGDEIRAAKRAGFKFPIYTDPKHWAEGLGVRVFPTKFLVRDGKLLVRSSGGSDRAYEHWDWLIRRELQPDEATKAP